MLKPRIILAVQLLLALMGMAVAVDQKELTGFIGSKQQVLDQSWNHEIFEWPEGDARRCQEKAQLSRSPTLKRFEVLPGVGWDNLRNTEAGMVVEYDFKHCKTTDDGLYLLPDNVFTVPIKTSKVQTFAEMIDSYQSSTSVTSNSVNVHVGLFGDFGSISGGFSYEHEQLKRTQIADEAITVRVQLRHHRYESKLQPDTKLSPQFKKRLLSIAANLELGREEQARYEGQLLVRDFGTHVLTSVTAGAGLVKDDYLKREDTEQQTEQKTQILAHASFLFGEIFSIGADFSHSSSEMDTKKYADMMTSSFIKTYGGPIFRSSNMSIDQWADGVDDNLVPMDRGGDPLNFMVTTESLPELPPTTLADVEKIVRESVEMYYERNTIRGCTDRSATAYFKPAANLDDGSCKANPTNLTFGGIFQKCSTSGKVLHNDPCKDLQYDNPKTGGFSCPPSYTAIELLTASRNGQPETETECHSCGIFGLKKCCHVNQYVATATYTAYWCAATGPVGQDSGYLFGGLYTSHVDNPVTGSRSCPPNFVASHLFTDMVVCLSDDYELGSSSSISFGGLFSCKTGNPLSLQQSKSTGGLVAYMVQKPGQSPWPARCPLGFSQHLATSDAGCSINYCVPTHSLAVPDLPPVKTPPFSQKPFALLEQQDNIVMFDMKSQTWKRDEEALLYQAELEKSQPAMASLALQWAKIKTQASKIAAQESFISAHESSIDPQDTDIDIQSYGIMESKKSEHAMSAGQAAGLSAGVTLACVILVALIVLTVRKSRIARRRQYGKLEGETIVEPKESYGAASSDNDANSAA